MSSIYVNFIFSVFCADKFAVQTHGLERFSAILVELTEEFQTLQSQIMYITSEQIQTEIHRMSEQEDNHKSNHRTGI